MIRNPFALQLIRDLEVTAALHLREGVVLFTSHDYELAASAFYQSALCHAWVRVLREEFDS